MEYLPFGETMVDEHLNSRNSPFKYNGKEFDEETGNYYYGARYYEPKWSIWLSVDPLAEKTMSSYGYCYNNPINLVDPNGMEGLESDDIIFKDKKGNSLATYHDGNDETINVTLPIENYGSSPNVNLNKLTDKLPDVDVIGINLGGEFTVGGRASLNYQFAYFLDGKDEGKGSFFYSVTGNLGLSVGVGITGFAGDFIGKKGDENMSMNDYLGGVSSYNIGVGAFSGNYWWSSNLDTNQPELWPGMGSYHNNKEQYEQTWRGFSGGAASGLKGGASVSHGITKHLKWVNNLLNLKG